MAPLLEMLRLHAFRLAWAEFEQVRFHKETYWIMNEIWNTENVEFGNGICKIQGKEWQYNIKHPILNYFRLKKSIHITLKTMEWSYIVIEYIWHHCGIIICMDHLFLVKAINTMLLKVSLMWKKAQAFWFLYTTLIQSVPDKFSKHLPPSHCSLY